MRTDEETGIGLAFLALVETMEEAGLDTAALVQRLTQNALLARHAGKTGAALAPISLGMALQARNEGDPEWLEKFLG